MGMEIPFNSPSAYRSKYPDSPVWPLKHTLSNTRTPPGHCRLQRQLLCSIDLSQIFWQRKGVESSWPPQEPTVHRAGSIYHSCPRETHPLIQRIRRCFCLVKTHREEDPFAVFMVTCCFRLHFQQGDSLCCPSHEPSLEADASL